MAEAATATDTDLLGVDDPMGWTANGPDAEQMIKLVARQTLKDEDTLREHSVR